MVRRLVFADAVGPRSVQTFLVIPQVILAVLQVIRLKRLRNSKQTKPFSAYVVELETIACRLTCP